MSVADQRYLQRVAQDCTNSLGSGVEVQDVELDADGDVVLRWLRLGTAEWTSEGRGETVIAAHAALREQLVLDRIRLGIRALMRPPPR